MRARDAAVALGLWALFNAILAALLVGFRHNWVQLADYWLAVAFVLLLALIARRVADPPVRRVPEASAGALALALAVVMLVLGASVGLFAALIGVELIVVSIVVLVRERAG